MYSPLESVGRNPHNIAGSSPGSAHGINIKTRTAENPGSPATSAGFYGSLLDSPARRELLAQRSVAAASYEPESILELPLSLADDEGIITKAVDKDKENTPGARRRSAKMNAALAEAAPVTMEEREAPPVAPTAADPSGSSAAGSSSRVIVFPVSVPPPPMLSLRQVIFDPASYLNAPLVAVSGSVVVLDLEMARMDVSSDGAKLIVNLAKLDQSSVGKLACGEKSSIGIGSKVVVVGRVQKEQRRTFLEAASLSEVDAPAE